MLKAVVPVGTWKTMATMYRVEFSKEDYSFIPFFWFYKLDRFLSRPDSDHCWRGSFWLWSFLSTGFRQRRQSRCKYCQAGSDTFSLPRPVITTFVSMQSSLVAAFALATSNSLKIFAASRFLFCWTIARRYHCNRFSILMTTAVITTSL